MKKSRFEFIYAMILKIIDDKIWHQLWYQHAKTINLETYDNTFLSFHKKYWNDSLNYEFQKNFKKWFLDYRYQNSEFRKKNISKYFDNKNEFFMLYQQENYWSICEELYNKEINNYLYTNHLEENDNSIGKYIKSNTKDIAYIEECKRYIINYKFQKSKTSIILEYISQDSYKGYQINWILDFIVGFALHFILILFLLSIIYPIVSFIYITYIYKWNGIINSKELFEMSKVSHINLDDFSIIPKLKRWFIATLILIIRS